MPVQYVIEEWDFRDLTLKMKPPVFIPRPETEVKNFSDLVSVCPNFATNWDGLQMDVTFWINTDRVFENIYFHLDLLVCVHAGAG